MAIIIRKENTEDYESVFEIHKLAFGQDNEGRLVELLRKSDSFIPQLSLVAIKYNQVAGHILFTKIKIVKDDNTKNESLALAPIAVRPESQRMGIGAQLIQHGFEKARDLQYKSVIVLGHEHYYTKLGFMPADKWNIKPPFDVPKNNFMAIELETDALKNISGIVQYPKEFESL